MPTTGIEPGPPAQQGRPFHQDPAISRLKVFSLDRVVIEHQMAAGSPKLKSYKAYFPLKSNYSNGA